MFSIKSSGQRFDTKESIEPELQGLTKDVKTANFGGSSYGVEACKAIAEHLKPMSELEVINLDDVFTGRDREEITEAMHALVDAMLKLPKLHTINLSDNAFGIASVEPLERLLAEHVPLQHLFLSNNGLGPQAGSRIGRALEVLKQRKDSAKSDAQLQTVICGRNRLENGSMEAWAAYIKAHGSLKVLKLYQNGIRQEGVQHMMLHGLKYATQLQTLDMQDNTFTYKGCVALADALGHWNDIKELAISDCLLGSKGGALLADKLRDSKNVDKLSVLRLQYNELDVKGLKKLVDAVESNLQKLELLELNGNCFADDHLEIARISELFSSRGLGELDELDDMEEPDSDEEGSEEDDDLVAEQLAAGSRDSRLAEDEPVAGPEKDDEVDKLAKDIKQLSTDS